MRKILEEKLISIPEVKDILTKLENNIGKENFDSFQESTLDYAQMFSKIDDLKKVEKIKKMLSTDYNLDEEFTIMVINILPNSVEELRVIFEKDLNASKISDDDLQELIYKIQDLAK